MSGIVIIGAGQAGASLAARLRALKYDGSITLIGEEPVPPYQRPPLSKQYLLGEMGLDRLLLRSESFYEDQNITLMTGTQVASIDPTAKTVALADGRTMPYTQLALTTGSVPRKLPPSIGGTLEGVYTVRTLADVDAMTTEFRPNARVLIVGGGYIGLEAAAVASKLGLDVTLIEMAPRILQRVAARETSNYFRNLHLSKGVTLLEGTGLERLTGDTRVTGVILSDGNKLDADFVIVGVGIIPATSLAEDAGLSIENGIRSDEFGRTSDGSIWAAGDCASFPWKDARLRLESVGNAIDQAECVAENMLGAQKPYLAKPWFWSDQYDVKLQIAGLNTGYDRIVTRQGEGDAVSFWYYQGDTLLAVDAMNDARAYMIGKRLIDAGRSPDPATIADAATDLKALLK
jgi:3-phenylpropionate/trans-cinnamate dioxygenase ferredoxin reductase subunit